MNYINNLKFIKTLNFNDIKNFNNYNKKTNCFNFQLLTLPKIKLEYRYFNDIKIETFYTIAFQLKLSNKSTINVYYHSKDFYSQSKGNISNWSITKNNNGIIEHIIGDHSDLNYFSTKELLNYISILKIFKLK